VNNKTCPVAQPARRPDPILTVVLNQLHFMEALRRQQRGLEHCVGSSWLLLTAVLAPRAQPPSQRAALLRAARLVCPLCVMSLCGLGALNIH
jgi:hypothetical protein